MNFDRLRISSSARIIVSTCFDKNYTTTPQLFASWSTKQTHFAMTSSVLFLSWCPLLLVLPLNWIHSKTISAAAFRIIPKIEFLLLDWIYCSIRVRQGW